MSVALAPAAAVLAPVPPIGAPALPAAALESPAAPAALLAAPVGFHHEIGIGGERAVAEPAESSIQKRVVQFRARLEKCAVHVFEAGDVVLGQRELVAVDEPVSCGFEILREEILARGHVLIRAQQGVDRSVRRQA